MANKNIYPVKLTNRPVRTFSVLFAFTFIFFNLILFFSKSVTFEELKTLVVNIPVLALFVVSIICPIMIWAIFKKKLLTFNGTNQDLERCNKLVKQLRNFSVIFPVLFSIAIPVMMFFWGSKNELEYEMYEGEKILAHFLSLYLGIFLQMSAIAYSLYLSIFEKELIWLHYSRKDKTLSITKRLVVMNVISIIGTVSAVVSILTTPGIIASGNFFDILFPIILIFIISTSSITINTFTNVQQVSTVIKTLNLFLDDLEKKDYRSKPLKVTNRNELGELINGVNKFYDVTKGLLKDFRHSSESSKESSESLNVSIEESFSRFQIIENSVSTVRQDMANQAKGVEDAHSTTAQIINQIKALNAAIEKQSAGISQSSSAVEEMVANVNSVS